MTSQVRPGPVKKAASWIALLSAIALFSMVVAGCGSDDDPDCDHDDPCVSASPTPTPVTSPTPTPTPTPVPVGACLPSSSLSVGVLAGTKNVVSYVPKGAWDTSTTGVSLVQVEGTGITSTTISTPNTVNSCSSNSVTGETVCTANNTDVYTITGSTLTNTLTSGGTGTISFSGGTCTNCGVTIDTVNNKALIGLSVGGNGGYQQLDLSVTPPTFGTAVASQDPSHEISEDLLIDSGRDLLLSPAEDGNFEIVEKQSGTSPEFFENSTYTGAPEEFDSAAEDCSTGIALASIEFTSNLFIADLTQGTFTPGSPSGTWSAPSQTQSFSPDFDGFSAGTCGIAVAQGTHTGVVTGEFGGNQFGAILLPSTSGSGTPAVADWVACTIPNDPTSAVFDMGLDPHTVTAYQSPNTGDAMALIANGDFVPPTFLAVIDLTKLLNTTIVPRTAGTHTCDPSTNLVTAGVVSFVAVP